jgi:hypothetical protein
MAYTSEAASEFFVIHGKDTPHRSEVSFHQISIEKMNRGTRDFSSIENERESPWKNMKDQSGSPG